MECTELTEMFPSVSTINSTKEHAFILFKKYCISFVLELELMLISKESGKLHSRDVLVITLGLPTTD